MASERYFSAKEAVLQADGGRDGRVVLASTRGFKVKSKVTITATGLPPIELEVKHVESKTILFVGPIGDSIDARSDVSSYVTSLNAKIKLAKQKRMAISVSDHQRATYEEEPTVATRAILVDPEGNLIDDTNPLPTMATVSLTDETTVSTPIILNVGISTTESSVIVPKTAKRFTMRRRDAGSVRLAYVPGGSHLTIAAGACYHEDSLKLLSPLSLYLSANTAGTIELIYWE